MKKTLYRAISALLAACLCLTLGCSFALAGSGALPVDTSVYPAPNDAGLSSDKAFERGNECYKAGKYMDAAGYYAFALKGIGNSTRYTEGDVCNNLVLTLLQLEQNEEAYALCRWIMEESMAKTEKDAYGYMLNMLVCAQANGITAAEELKYAVDQGLFSFDRLDELADKEPGKYTKLLVALLYNAVYMDMEASTADGGAAYAYYPADRLDSISGSDIMEQLGRKYGSEAGSLDGNDRAAAEKTLSRKAYLKFLLDVLEKVNDLNYKVHGIYDPDVTKLINYLNVLREQS